MANDVDIYDGGELQPYGQPLAPSPLDGEIAHFSPSRDELTNPEIDQYQWPRQMTLFGTELPFGTTKEQVDAVLNQVGAAFMGDFVKLKYPHKLIAAANYFIRENALKKPFNVVPKHPFDLHGHDDWLGNAFANHLIGLPGTNREKQQFLTACLQWLTRLSQQQVTQAQGSAPPTTSGNDGLSDAEYNALYDYNVKIGAPRTEGILREKWGDAYEANRRMTDNYLQSLSDVERRHFDHFLNNGLHALNDPTVILGLWGQAVGINNLPRGGAALADEINMMHDAMKNNRKQWLADERMQSRYRELIRIRDGG